MPLPTAEQVTNLYLYGTTTRPADLTDGSLLQPRPAGAIAVDVNDYMTSGAGRFVGASDFDFVTDFFFPLTSIAAGTYSKDAIFKLLGYRDPVTGADLKDGVLAIELVREVPEAMKPRRIAINGGSSTLLDQKKAA